VAEDTEVSREAFERVQRDRDDLKTKLAQVESALSDVALRDRFYEQFRQDQTIRDPYGLASLAIRDVTLKSVPAEQVGERLGDWLNEQRRLIAAPSAETVGEPAATHAPASPFQGPNPGAAGYQAKMEPMVVGGQRWNEWAKGKSADEKLAAMRRGDAVTSEKVKRAQGTVGTGAP